MKKFPLLTFCVFLIAGVFVFEWAGVSLLPSPRYWIEKWPNAKKTGDFVFYSRVNEDETYLLVCDSLNTRQKTISLDQLRYSSTQGCEYPFWSKDRMMCAIYSDPAPWQKGSPWVRGYDWKTHQLLDQGQTERALFSHGGKGKSIDSLKPWPATPQEIASLNLKSQP